MNDNPLDFTGKVALATGAAWEWTWRHRRRSPRQGATVVLTDFREDAAKAESQKLMTAGYQAARSSFCEGTGAVRGESVQAVKRNGR